MERRKRRHMYDCTDTAWHATSPNVIKMKMKHFSSTELQKHKELVPVYPCLESWVKGGYSTVTPLSSWGLERVDMTRSRFVGTWCSEGLWCGLSSVTWGRRGLKKRALCSFASYCNHFLLCLHKSRHHMISVSQWAGQLLIAHHRNVGHTRTS